jgi:glycosyltransferase involved in cell wall biosynthesis
MSHVNLLLVGILIKMINPGVKLVLIAHGIEVWRPVAAWKRYLLQRISLFLPVSHFTQDKMRSLYRIPEEKFRVMYNCLDPFLELPLHKARDTGIMARYGLQPGDKILLTVTRMADTEMYKGYDKVIHAMAALIKKHPNLHYLLVGKYGSKEKARLDEMIAAYGLKGAVQFAGFVPDEELPAHFRLADVFVMPSQKEGFGLVFIEAMYYGLPVIAGNADGSVDALLNGELGLLVNPTDTAAIQDAIEQVLANPEKYKPDQHKLMGHFSYEGYKEKWKEVLEC